MLSLLESNINAFFDNSNWSLWSNVIKQLSENQVDKAPGQGVFF